MNKNEDMKKLLFAEVIGFNKLRRIKFLSIFFCFSLIPSMLFTQVERNLDRIILNGFGRYLLIDKQTKLFNLFTYDCDEDGLIDIGGIDESGQNVYIYYGKSSYQFSKPVKYTFGSKYSGVLVKKLNLNNRPNLIVYSKLDGVINIYSFIKRSLSRKMLIKVDCCFSDINAVNIDQSPELEIFLFGPNFKGIGIISLNNLKYTYKKIFDSESFNKLIPFYLNSDNRIDLVGFNNLSRNLILFRNNSHLNFSKNVYKKFDETIDELLSGNFDDDLLNDIVLISNNSKTIYFLYGNGIGSFGRKDEVNIKSNYSISLVLDYNRDLIDDLIVYDKFGKNLHLNIFLEFKKKVISQNLIRLEKFYSVANYRTLTTKGIVVSSDKGLFLIHYSRFKFDNERYCLTSSISDIATSKSRYDLYSKLFVLDSEQRKLYIISRNEFNTPQEVLLIPLSYSYERLKILREDDEEVVIACFKPLMYYFDFFKINYNTQTYTRQIITVEDLIEDIGYEISSDNQDLLSVLVHRQNKLRIFLIKPFDLNKIALKQTISQNELIDYAFDFSSKELFYLTKNDFANKFELWLREFDLSYKFIENKKIFDFKDKNYLSVSLNICDVYDDSKIAFINLSNLNENKLLVIPLDQATRNFTIDNVKIEENLDCQCTSITGMSAKIFSYYNLISKSIEEILFDKRGYPTNYSIKQLPVSNKYSISGSLNFKTEIIYVSDYSIINIERINK